MVEEVLTVEEVARGFVENWGIFVLLVRDISTTVLLGKSRWGMIGHGDRNEEAAQRGGVAFVPPKVSNGHHCCAT
jgi:hypothetical protein